MVQGRAISLPVVVRDAVSITAMFAVRSAAMRALLPTARLHPAELLPGWSACVLGGIEYKDNDLGCYNEVAISFLVVEGERAPLPLVGLVQAFRAQELGAYIHRLPVTTSFSRDAGRDIWGFPKTVDDITFHDGGGQRTCRLVADGEHVLTLSVVRRGHGMMAPTPQVSWAWRDGTLYRTPCLMSGNGVGNRLGGATLVLGSHPIADELRGLGLPRRALFSTSVEQFRASFDAPEAT